MQSCGQVPRSVYNTVYYIILYNLSQCRMLQSEPVIQTELMQMHSQIHSLEHLDRQVFDVGSQSS